jgi:TolB protein
MRRALAAGIAVAATAVGADALLNRARPRSEPSGELFFSTAGLRDIAVARIGRAEYRRLNVAKGPQFDPAVSPDGRHIVYRDSRRGINHDDEIYVMDRDGSHPRDLTRNHANDWSPAWSPDGRSIAFASERSGTLALWVMAADGSRPRRLTEVPAEYPSWSPDGSRIAFSLVSAGAVQIGVVRRDGTGEHALTPVTVNSELPAWSPDGARIAFSRGFERARSIWTVGADGSDPRAVTDEGEDDVAPAWSPDGRRLVFARREVLMTVRPDGTGLRSLRLAGALPDWAVAREP